MTGRGHKGVSPTEHRAGGLKPLSNGVLDNPGVGPGVVWRRWPGRKVDRTLALTEFLGKLFRGKPIPQKLVKLLPAAKRRRSKLCEVIEAPYRCQENQMATLVEPPGRRTASA